MRTPARLAILLAGSAVLFGCDPLSKSTDPQPGDFAASGAGANGGASPTATTDGTSVPSSSPPPAPPPKKKDGSACAAAGECASGVCGADETCAAPSPTDGVKNGDETDVDCGGAVAPKCAATRACLAASDCASNACSADKKCQVAPSCTGKLGADDHCGPNLDESCCASLPVGPVDYSVAKWGLDAHVSAFRLDKYEITVGRMRAFFTAMQGSPQASFERVVGANAGANPHVPGSGWHPSWTKRLPANWEDIASRYGDPAQAGSGTQFCMRGAGGDYGTTTYRRDADANARIVDNGEVKPIVCIDWYTLFAFCAWDGGRLPTSTEWGAAAGDDLGYVYAWGNDAPSQANVVTALKGFVPYPDFTWGLPYRTAGDRGTHIAPPGQKQAGVGRWGHYDLSGNVAEWLLDSHVPTGTCTDCADIADWKDPIAAWPDYEPTLGAGSPTWKDGGYRVVRGGTWEGHDIRNFEGTFDGIEVGFTYHAFGGRCARDL